MKRRTTRFAIGLLACAALAAPTPARAVPGDTFEDPIVVDPLPVLVTGTTCGRGDEASDLCLAGTGGAPDVFFRFTPDHDGRFAISSCGSWFPNNLVLYDGSGRVLRCRQDECLFGGYDRFLLRADSTYLIAIEGEDGWCGEYVFSIEDCPDQCDGAFARCTPDGFHEGEPTCSPGYVDHFNDGSCSPTGCNVSPVPCTGTEVTICGTNGQPGLDVVDVDVYEFLQESPSHVTLALASEHATLMAVLTRFVDGKDPEWVVGFHINNGILYEGTLEPGRYWLRLVVDSHASSPCDNPTVLRFTGLSCTSTPTPAERSSWGALKATYR